MGLYEVRKSLADYLVTDCYIEWAQNLDYCTPGIYAVNDVEVDLTDNNLFIDINAGTFTFSKVNFYINVRLGSSGKDGHDQSFKKVVAGDGVFTLHPEGKITVSEINIEGPIELFM